MHLGPEPHKYSGIEAMTFEEAKALIRDGCDNWSKLVEAAGTICDAPESSFDDLLACLKHRGLPQEFAAMKLYVRTKRPRENNAIDSLITDPQNWAEYLRKKGFV
jgi:hypothetical protein